MPRFLLASLAFLLINGGVQLALGQWYFQRIDLRVEAGLALLLVPVGQVLVLWLALYPRQLSAGISELLGLLLRGSGVSLVLLIDLGILLVGWTLSSKAWASLGQERSIPLLYMALKEIVGAAVLGRLVWRYPLLRMPWTLAGTVLLLLAGLEVVTPWSEAVLDLLLGGLPGWLRYLVIGLCWLVALGLLLMTAIRVGRISEETALLLDCAAFCLGGRALLGAVGAWLSTGREEVWQGVVGSAAFLSVSLIWLAILTLKSELEQGVEG